MTDFRVVVSDTSAGKPLADIPMAFSGPYTRTINGAGSCSGTLSLDHPKCTPAVLEGDREITVFRDDAVDWNGPISTLKPQKSTGLMEITAREPTWILAARTLEVTKHFNADVYYIIRWLFNYALTKRSNGLTTGGTTINAGVPRFVIAPASGNSGVVRHVAYNGTDRRFILDIINDLVADPTFGLDYKVVYSGADRQSCTRTFTLGSPSLGVTRTRKLTEHVLQDYGYVSDRDRAANRVHTVAAGYTYTLQNSGSVTAGDSLLERVFDRTDTSSHAKVQSFTSEARRVSQPPVRTYLVTYKPSPALPYGWCDLGDTVPLAISSPAALALAASRRVMEIATTPPSAGQDESVSLSFNLPLDQLGT